jgi:AcrR family transcriptional regulator
LVGVRPLRTITYRQYVCTERTLSRQAARSEATRAKLVAAARDLFAKRGYAGVGTEEIVKRARVTRGALYHHFADKRELFRAVHEALEAELVERIAAALADAQTEDPIEAMKVAVSAFLDGTLDEGRARITLIEAPSVLGWAEWREIDARHGLGLASGALEGAMAAGRIERQPVAPLANLFVAALGEAGILVATADDPAAMRAEVEGALGSLIDGLALPA